jgi:DNA-binding transcriptional ArsR family regulator
MKGQSLNPGQKAGPRIDFTAITGTKTKQLVLNFLSANSKNRYSVLDMHNMLNIPESTLSINMTELSKCGVVVFEKKGKYKYYRVVERYVPALRSIFSSLTELACQTGGGKR